MDEGTALEQVAVSRPGPMSRCANMDVNMAGWPMANSHARCRCENTMAIGAVPCRAMNIAND
ncbi:hypothetical protein BLOT_004836 [Blomia tropicalis]|nr:hypothetical protein BLOT_004836 [Blomia tropicalis]